MTHAEFNKKFIALYNNTAAESIAEFREFIESNTTYINSAFPIAHVGWTPLTYALHKKPNKSSEYKTKEEQEKAYEQAMNTA